MNLCAIAYVPPPSVCNGDVFLRNIRKFDCGVPLILFSEHDYPDVIKLPRSPDFLRRATYPNGKPNQWALSNALFLTACRMARDRGSEFFLYVEADCRVGRNGWAKDEFDEFFAVGRPLIAAGSLVTYNPCNAGHEAAMAWAKLVAQNEAKNYPIPTYGWMPSADTGNTCVFPNGALGIYSTEWMREFFNLDNTLRLSCEAFAWDFLVGREIWKRFEHHSYDVVAHLRTIYSAYGNVLTTEEQRMEMLRSGKVGAVHQVKSGVTI